MKKLLLLSFLLFSISLAAQPGDPVDPDVPITGIEILLGMGGLYGVRKLLKLNSKSDQR